MKEPEILVDSWSPVCEIQAFVEESESCCYFYLWFYPGQENSYVKSCWICNTIAAPEGIDKEAMENGNAPAMPAEYVKHDKNGIQLVPETLSIVWFEEGDAAALLEDGKLLCVIPGWGGYQGFNGYSGYAIGTAPFAWELSGAQEVLDSRIKKSQAFWEYFEGDFWGSVQQMHLDILEKFFGKHEKYYAIDGGKFPPKALVTGKKNEICYGITAGVSMIPMPQVEQYYQEQTDDFRRIELGFAASLEPEQVCMKMYSFLSGLSALPWQEIGFLGHGHTIPCNVIDGFCAVLFLNSNCVSEIPSLSYPDFMGDRINLLWLVPLREKEYQMIKEIGVEEFLNRLGKRREEIYIFSGENKISWN